MALAVAPTVPAPRTGDIYYDSALGSIRHWDGAAWHTYVTLDQTQTITGTKTFSTPIGISSGGTNSAATATLGGVGYGTGTAHAYTGAGTATQVLTSAGAAAPVWATLDLTYLPGASFKEPVKAASTVNVALTGLQTVDTISLVATDRVLLKNQTAPAENGIWIVQSGAWNRPPGADASGDIAGALVSVDSGVQGGTRWVTTFKTTDTINTTAMNWFANLDASFLSSTTPAPNAVAGTVGTGTTLARADHVHAGVSSLSGTANQISASASGGLVTLSLPAAVTISGLMTAAGFANTGQTGAVSATRYVGGTASVAPTSGTFLAGDWVIALTGVIWICTVGGTPGTWVNAAAGSGGVTSLAVTNNASVNASTGAVTITNSMTPSFTSVSLSTPLQTASGGTGANIAGNAGSVIYGVNTAQLGQTAVGSAGQLLTSTGATAPAWVTLVPVANGGTNSSATATAGGIGYGTGTAHAYSAAGTTGQFLKSGVAGAPTWVTPASTDLSNDAALMHLATTETVTAQHLFFGGSGVVALQARAASAGNADALQIFDSSNVLRAKFDPSGNIAATNFVDIAGTGPYLNLGANTMIVQGRTSGNIPLTVKGAASQSVDIAQFVNSGGTTLVTISNVGTLQSFSNIIATDFSTGTFGTVTAGFGTFSQTVTAAGNGVFANSTDALFWMGGM
jgi:hypothetical protein